MRAGRAFGQIAATGDGGTLMVAAARAIEQEHRATVLLVADLFRIDLEPHGDSLGVHLRALGDHHCQWTSTPETIDALDRGRPMEPLSFEGHFDLADGPLHAVIKLLVVGDEDLQAVYVSARATVLPESRD